MFKLLKQFVRPIVTRPFGLQPPIQACGLLRPSKQGTKTREAAILSVLNGEWEIFHHYVLTLKRVIFTCEKHRSITNIEQHKSCWISHSDRSHWSVPIATSLKKNFTFSPICPSMEYYQPKAAKCVGLWMKAFNNPLSRLLLFTHIFSGSSCAAITFRLWWLGFVSAYLLFT